MAITKVRVQINSVWTNCTKNSAGKWVCSPTAPATTSYNLSGGYYPVTVEITNDAGTVATYNAASEAIGTALRLTVKETVKPVITLVAPTNGALVINNKQQTTFKVTDETGGSGLALSTLALKIDSNTYNQSSAGMVKTAITNGYQFVYTPQAALADGEHTITINVKDNDGNSATAISTKFKIDTVPPTLSITSPANALITNTKSLTLAGTTNDATSSPVTVTATLNGTSMGSITVSDNGAFSKAFTAAEGDNSIVVTARDSAGKTTTITRTFKVDTTVPQLNSAGISPNPANASASIQITLDIT